MAATGPVSQRGVSPARLGFLTIFNPSLGNTDETVEDQIVYYTSVTTQNNKRDRRNQGGKPTDGLSQEERHERLRQIGLAQGMASFGLGFSDGISVDTIETEKSRVVLHELEPGWWILASVDLTRIPLPPRLPIKTAEQQEERFEYSSREMKPSNLLLSDLLRAHSIFLMHHDISLSALFTRYNRTRFVTTLSRYWDLFLSTWNVMMHGNPIRDIFRGINIAASGELGVGVGEEDRGSGEREVLEGLVGRVEGLVDIVASRFGGPSPPTESQDAIPDEQPQSRWLGKGQEPAAEDGAVFLGVGALSRKSLRNVTHWMEDLYTWGEHTYGIIESPTSVRRQRRRSRRSSKQENSSPQASPSTSRRDSRAFSPLPEEDAQVVKPSNPKDVSQAENKTADIKAKHSNTKFQDHGTMSKMASYLKMGYGTYWSIPGGSSGDPVLKSPDDQAKPSEATPVEVKLPTNSKGSSQKQTVPNAGHFLIGLKGGIEEVAVQDNVNQEDQEDSEHNSRILLRTIHVELETETGGLSEAITDNSVADTQVLNGTAPAYTTHDHVNKTKKHRVVVYVNRPFIFTFIFALRTDSLAWDSLYRSLHHQLAPLKKPLLSSTRYRPDRPSAGSEIHDLVWDPLLLSLHSNIPNIPETYEPQDSWSRADALSTHLHLLNIHAATRTIHRQSPHSPYPSGALERTQKTSRGWWVVWTRLRSSNSQDQREDLSSSLSTIREPEDRILTAGKEIMLVRRASDHIGFRSEASAVANGGASGLIQGIGVDTRRYVEELLTLL